MTIEKLTDIVKELAKQHNELEAKVGVLEAGRFEDVEEVWRLETRVWQLETKAGIAAGPRPTRGEGKQ